MGADGARNTQGKGVEETPRANVVCLASVQAWGLENIHIESHRSTRRAAAQDTELRTEDATASANHSL